MKLRFHHFPFTFSPGSRTGSVRCHWTYLPAVTFILLFHSMASETRDLTRRSDKDIPEVIASNTGYYCYLRCLAKCVDYLGASSFHKTCKAKCGAYYDDKLCNKTDESCWSSCRDLISKSDAAKPKPKPPRNVTVSYTRFPQPTPYEADVHWSPSGHCSFFIVQYADVTDAVQSWTKGGLEVNETTSNHWHFIKPHLCPEYSFRVAAVNAHGISPFSDIVVLPEPVPIVPSPFYDLVSSELINEPFASNKGDDPDVRWWNQTLRAVVTFAPPPNWDLETDIVDVIADFYPESSGGYVIGYAPQKKWIKGTSEFELRMPGGMGEDLRYKLIFAVQKLITKCQTKDRSSIGYSYPSWVYNPTRRMMLPVLEFELTCKNTVHSNCPFENRDLLPSCAVHAVEVRTTHNNGTGLVDANVAFDHLLETRNHPVLYYLVAYGEGEEPSANVADLVPPSMTGLAGKLKVQNSTKQFQLEGLRPQKLYVMYICGIYTEGMDYVDWNLTSRYIIDLTDTDTAQSASEIGSTGTASTVWIVAPTSVALLVALAVCAFIIRKHWQKKAATRCEAGSSVGMIDDRYVEQPRRFDRWEIPRRRLIINRDEKLGSGAFGAVYKGRVMGELFARERSQLQSTEERMRAENCVAVKMLPEYADEKSKSDFRAEINVMKQLGYHERLVNMLACITADEPFCLIVEYCPHGDLLHYLRARKTYMANLERIGIDLNDPNLDKDVDRSMLLSLKDVVSFAWQISVGLEYISQKGYIHRDVAARNVLVDNVKRVKIGDFGLCRYASKDPVYMGKGGRLPIKWMALEALKSYEFTTKSDVWSYGVLVYELFTVGNAPYPGVDPSDVERFLDSGRRMAQPPQCPLDLYMIMLSCWQEFPESRPTFTELRQRLLLMLENIAADYYYTQVMPSVSAHRRKSSVRNIDQSDHWPTVEECDLDDQVFEIEASTTRSMETKDKAERLPVLSAPPPLPPRRFRSKNSSVTSATDEEAAPFSPTRRTHQRESTSSAATGEPTLISEGGSDTGAFKFRYVAKYTPSVDLTTVPEKERTKSDCEHGRGGEVSMAIPTEPQSPRLRRRSSTVSNSAHQSY